LICLIIGFVIGLFFAVLFLGVASWLAGPGDQDEKTKSDLQERK